MYFFIITLVDSDGYTVDIITTTASSITAAAHWAERVCKKEWDGCHVGEIQNDGKV